MNNKEFASKYQIKKPSKALYDEIKLNWDHIAKPLDGLGDFETLLCKVGAAQNAHSPSVSKRAVIMMISDNGVVEEGISQSGQDVTLAVAKAMGAASSSVCKMAKACNTDTIPVNVGINTDEEIPGVLNCSVAKGTRNFAKEYAMTEEEAIAAIEAGIEVVRDCKEKGYDLLATGEMGIGNTTTSVAVAASLLRRWEPSMTGRGAGLTDAGLSKKTQVIAAAIEKYGLMDKDPLEILCAVGGFDIAGICGVFIGGALYNIPVVIDGLISGTAALLAEKLLPGTVDYMLPSHQGKEPVLGMILEELGLSSIIKGNLALGEGTGAVMIFPLFDMAMALYSDGNSFDDISVEQYERKH